MPDVTISLTAEQAQRIAPALRARYGQQPAPRWLKLMLRDLVREYEAGEARRQAFEEIDALPEEDWGD